MLAVKTYELLYYTALMKFALATPRPETSLYTQIRSASAQRHYQQAILKHFIGTTTSPDIASTNRNLTLSRNISAFLSTFFCSTLEP